MTTKNKRCFVFCTVKFIEEFSKNHTKKDGRQTKCKKCASDYYKQHYRKNKLYYKDKTARIKKRNRQFIFNYLSQHGCVNCPETDPIVLTFDHIIGDKQFNLADAASNQYSIARIKQEIAKCQVRCFNCHARKTAKEFGWYQDLQPYRDGGTG